MAGAIAVPAIPAATIAAKITVRRFVIANLTLEIEARISNDIALHVKVFWHRFFAFFVRFEF
ncbi:hypothetical protein VB735_01830 [Halotia wernerae UHCC 0503]|nr:hypothetical protein [Halotia wernerae UHCC 0503]